MKLNTSKGICMLGRTYSFFLNNVQLGTAYYQYSFVSPKVSNNLLPYLSLKLVNERSQRKFSINETGLLFDCLGVTDGNYVEENVSGLIKGILKKEQPINLNCEDKSKFPMIEMKSGNNLQKTLIVGLRDAMRWKNYKFFPGRKVDILYTPTKYLVMEIKGDRETDKIWLEPVGLYKNEDANMLHPIKTDLMKLDFPKDILTGKSKASDLNRLIKKCDWASFTRNEV